MVSTNLLDIVIKVPRGKDPDVSKSSIEPDAFVSATATIGRGTRVWGLAQVREHARVGEDCIIGRGSYVGAGVEVGNNCKIQNDALIYEPARLGDGVFVGPAVVMTNDLFPRAVNPDGSPKTGSDWLPVGVVAEDGASIGARAVCVAPLRIGAWAMIAAGSVVTKDVAPYSLVRGVPARHVGWVGRAGMPLRAEGEFLVCPLTDDIYEQVAGQLRLKEQ